MLLRKPKRMIRLNKAVAVYPPLRGGIPPRTVAVYPPFVWRFTPPLIPLDTVNI
jgi:hypothetical protein